MNSDSNKAFDGSLEQIQETVTFVRSKIGDLNPELGKLLNENISA